MRDKIELLVEETGAPPQEAELALGLANFDMEGALKLIHSRMQDIFVIKTKFLGQHPQMYGLMLFIAHVGRPGTNPSFRLRFVFSANPHLYQTDLNMPWYEFEKAIYRVRLSEWCHMALSQSIEKEWEEKIAAATSRLFALKESLLAGQPAPIGLWIDDLLTSSHHWRVPPKFHYATDVLSVGEYRQGPPGGLSPWFGVNAAARKVREGELFMSLRIALESADISRPHGGLTHLRPAPVFVKELQAGDIVNVYVLESRETGLYLAEIFGGYSDHGLHPVEAPIESVWRESDLVGVRVRFGHAVVGEGTFPPDLRVQSIRKSQKTPFLKRVFGW